MSSVVEQNQETGDLEVCSYAHLIDSCSQDWFSVLSVLEDVLRVIRERHVNVVKVHLRSDEAGCYHNSHLIASLKDMGERVGVKVMSYDYSEPQQGKDICDRVLCPLKHAIHKYCNEGHDILTASDMRRALRERPVTGTTASVNRVDPLSMTSKIENIDGISMYHNVKFEETGIRVWKAHGIGEGKLIPFTDITIEPQRETNLQQDEDFFSTENRKLRPKKTKDKEDDLFECSVVGCGVTFSNFEDLEMHLDVGQHNNSLQDISLYDKLRREWAEKFQTIDSRKKGKKPASVEVLAESNDSGQVMPMGWALCKSRGSVRFSKNVKDYLTEKFDLGELTGMKCNPSDVENDMRRARNEKDERRFTREEWLTASQIKTFFSRTAAARRKHGNERAGTVQDEDLEAIAEEIYNQEFVDDVLETLGVKHPIIYDDVYNLCDYFKKDKLGLFKVPMLRAICHEFEIPFKSKELKVSLVDKIKEMVSGCTCNT